jgi:two-component system chemotaxis response regulator CheB
VTVSAAGRTRVLIVDDSAVMRSLLRSVVASGDGLEVAGTAADGAAALTAIATERPDIVLLDVEMPVLDGLATLRQLRAQNFKMPVIMCSSLTQRGAAVTIEALASGASDYVAKEPSLAGRGEALRTLARDLLPKIYALTRTPGAASAQHPPAFSVGPPSNPALSAAQHLPFVPPALPPPAIVAIGVSTGGPSALDALLSGLPADFPLPILVVQHMPEVFTRLFADRLARSCRLHACEASESAPVTPGTIYIARGNWHMEVVASARSGIPPTLHLNQEPPENHCRPSVDALFRSVAKVYGSAVLAVVLTGMGYDGLAGARVIRAQGGSVLVQDQATSTIWGMPGAIAQAGLAHKVLPLAAIAPEIIRMAARSSAAFDSRTLTRMVI